MSQTKLNLSNSKFEQATGDTLNVSGATVVFGSLSYSTDYSGDFTDQSIPNVLYVVDTAFSYGSYFANQLTGTKGIGRDENAFRIQDALDENAFSGDTITWEFVAGGFQIYAHNDLEQTNFQASDNNVGFACYDLVNDQGVNFSATAYSDIARLSLSVNTLAGQLQLYISKDDGFEITDTLFNKGLKYKSNYSANYSARSLVDKGYVTGLTSSLLTGSTFSTKLNPIKTIGANYTVTSNDINYVIEVTGSTNRTITVPSGLTTGFNFTINNLMSANTVTIAPGTGTTLNLKGSVLATQYDGVSLYINNNFIRGFGNLT